MVLVFVTFTDVWSIDKHGTLGRIMLHDNYGIIAPIDALCSLHVPKIIEFYGCIHSIHSGL